MAFNLLKIYVENENDFKDFIVVPSLVDASKYKLLNILSVDIGECKNLKEYLSKLLGGKKADLTNVGELSVKTKQGKEIIELIDKAEVEDICDFDPTYTLTRENLDLDLELHALKHGVKMSHDKSSRSEAMFDLGKITKRSLSYEQIAEMLKKLKSFNEDFIKLGKKDHLLVIYEVLYAEKLEVLTASSTKSTTDVCIGSSREPLSDVNQNVPKLKTLATGNGAGFSIENEIQHGKSSWRAGKMGPFPIAYKCGKIRLICQKGSGKKYLKLTTMDKFYKPFDATDSHYHIPTSNEPSLENSQ